MNIEVFAGLKAFYDKRFVVEEQLVSIADLKNYLIGRSPEAASILQASRFAVNDELVALNYNLKADDNISVIPPSSGG